MQAEFFAAAMVGDTAKLLSLIEKDTTLVNKTWEYGNTGLAVAALGGYLEAVQALCDAGSNCELKNKWGNLPIHGAAGNGHVATTVYLARRKAHTVGTRGNGGCTPMHMAAGNGHRDTVDALAQLGGLVGASDDDMDTPLHLAAMFGRDTTADLLVRLGASISAANRKGQSPVDVARGERTERLLFTADTSKVPPVRIDIGMAEGEEDGGGAGAAEGEETGEMRMDKG